MAVRQHRKTASIAAAVFGGTETFARRILFILAPLLGAALAGLTYKLLFDRS